MKKKLYFFILSFLLSIKLFSFESDTKYFFGNTLDGKTCSFSITIDSRPINGVLNINYANDIHDTYDGHWGGSKKTIRYSYNFIDKEPVDIEVDDRSNLILKFSYGETYEVKLYGIQSLEQIDQAFKMDAVAIDHDGNLSEYSCEFKPL